MTFSIGSIKLNHITVLAPLAGITNLPFRRMVKDAGCGLVCTEMVSANGLVYGSAKTRQMLASCPEEKPLSVQIFGSDPVKMADAAAIVQASGADIIDMNFGCAVKKVLKSYSGAALMKNPALAELILKKVRDVIQIPLTIKMRSGWDASGKDAFRLARIAQDCGVDAITLHPRTASQGFSGKSDWTLIESIKKQVTIPVIGNGDIVFPQDALRMIHETGCDAVMIGRGALSNPWIFFQIHELMEGRAATPVDLTIRVNAMKHYVHDSARYFGEPCACRMMRSRLGWFVKGLPHGSRFRNAITEIRTCGDAEAIIDEFMNRIQREAQP
jgi:nifR3 family TIM-barrel protein